MLWRFDIRESKHRIAMLWTAPMLQRCAVCKIVIRLIWMRPYFMPRH